MKFILNILPSSIRSIFSLDSRVPLSYTLMIILESSISLVRGLLKTRKLIFLGQNSRILAINKFYFSGGIIRIEKNCHLDCISEHGIRIGTNFKLGSYSKLQASGSLKDIGKGIFLGDNVAISDFAHIGGAGGVEIGSETIIGHCFSAHPEDHIFNNPDEFIKNQGVKRVGIKIGTNCWIGAKVTILDGVKIGDNCVIGAGSVVTKSFPNNVLIAGVPAKQIRVIR